MIYMHFGFSAGRHSRYTKSIGPFSSVSNSFGCITVECIGDLDGEEIAYFSGNENAWYLVEATATKLVEMGVVDEQFVKLPWTEVAYTACPKEIPDQTSDYLPIDS